MRKQTTPPDVTHIGPYLAVSYAWVLTNLSPLLSWDKLHWLARVFEMLVWLCYGALYLLPAAALTYLVVRWAPARSTTQAVVATFSAGLVQTFLYADRTVYEMFDFHINGFVLNLVTTRGGIASMGASASSMYTFALVVGCIFALQLATWLSVKRICT